LLNPDAPASLLIDLSEQSDLAAKFFAGDAETCADLAAASIRAPFADGDAKATVLQRLAASRS
jgi:hypothetical protein